jgi:hypothetical protein
MNDEEQKDKPRTEAAGTVLSRKQMHPHALGSDSTNSGITDARSPARLLCMRITHGGVILLHLPDKINSSKPGFESKAPTTVSKLVSFAIASTSARASARAAPCLKISGARRFKSSTCFGAVMVKGGNMVG